MSKSKAQVAHLLRRYAAALSLEGANRFKLKAYRRAAETIEGLDQDIAELVEQGRDLTELPGIGKAISEIIVEIVGSGKLSRLDRTIEHLSPELVELATRPGLDPKKVIRVYKKLGISSLLELKKTLDAGRIGESSGSAH
jgi:DNA polymerase (family 10)